jgi:hypothetical protein
MYQVKTNVDKAREDAMQVQKLRFENVCQHSAAGCPDCLGMVAFCRQQGFGCSKLPMTEVCEMARRALPSAYGHLVLGMAFFGMSGVRSLEVTLKERFLETAVSHLQHCDQTHIGCLYLGSACGRLRKMDDAFRAFEKGSKIGFGIICMLQYGECYSTGFGVAQDKAKGHRIWEQALKKGATLPDAFYREWESSCKADHVDHFTRLLATDASSTPVPADSGKDEAVCRSCLSGIMCDMSTYSVCTAISCVICLPTLSTCRWSGAMCSSPGQTR